MYVATTLIRSIYGHKIITLIHNIEMALRRKMYLQPYLFKSVKVSWNWAQMTVNKCLCYSTDYNCNLRKNDCSYREIVSRIFASTIYL